MTEYLPPPPAEIVLDNPTAFVNPMAVAFDEQGGDNHQFVYRPDAGTDHYYTGTVRQFLGLRTANANCHQQRIRFEYLLNAYCQSGDVDSEIANEFAEIFDIELRRQVSYCVQVEYTFTVDLPIGTDPDDLVENLSFDVSPNIYSDVEMDNYDSQVIHSQWEDA
jgi:hypothetical protein